MVQRELQRHETAVRVAQEEHLLLTEMAGHLVGVVRVSRAVVGSSWMMGRMSAGVPVLEIGGSHVTAAVVSPAGWDVEVVERAKLDSQRSADEIVAQLVAAAKQLPLASGLAVALPGPFDFATGIAWYRGVEKFDSLYGHDLGKSLRELLELDRVVFLNDAEAFSVGEWTAGELNPDSLGASQESYQVGPAAHFSYLRQVAEAGFEPAWFGL